MSASFTGTLEEAEAQARAMIRANPGDPGGYHFYMLAAMSGGRADILLAVFEAAAAQGAVTPMMKGLAGRTHVFLGDAQKGLTLLTKAFAEGLQDCDYYRAAAAAHLALNQLMAAEEMARKALTQSPDDMAAFGALLDVLSAAQKFGEIASLVEQRANAPADIRIRRALALANLGHWDEFDDIAGDAAALDCRQSLRMQWLFALAYHPHWTAGKIKAAYAHWGEQITKELGGARPHDDANLQGRNPRHVGFLVGDFAQGSLMSFLREPARALQAAGYQLFAYVTRPLRDQVSTEVAAYFRAVHAVHHLNDEALALQVRQDDVIVLIDMAALSAGGRPGLFARRAAPVQLAWHGTGFTTGLPAMDGFIGDDALLPPDAEAAMTEPHLLRLATGANAWSPPAAAPDVQTRQGDGVVFCCLARPIRFNASVYRCWAEMLRQVPGSRLILNCMGFGAAENRTIAAKPLMLELDRLGIAQDRVTLMQDSPVWATYGAADIALDPFPHGAATTMLDALWMGLPVVTLAARPPAGRWGASILTAIGKSQWITASEEDYIARGVALAGDLDQRKEARRGLRAAITKSGLCDGDAFASSFAEAFNGHWPQFAGGSQ